VQSLLAQRAPINTLQSAGLPHMRWPHWGNLDGPAARLSDRYSLNEPTIVSVSRSGSDAPKADTRSYGLREDLSERSSCVDQWTELAFSGMLAVR